MAFGDDLRILAEPSSLVTADPQPRNKPRIKYGGFIQPFNPPPFPPPSPGGNDKGDLRESSQIQKRHLELKVQK